MKKFWKALGIAALAAAVIPYRVEGDEDTGALTVQALLWKLTQKPGADGGKDVDIRFLSFGKDEEDGLFTDDPEEAMLFADDEPEAAVLAAEEAAIAANEAAVAAEEAAIAAEEAAIAAEEAAQEEAGEAGSGPEQ